MFSLVLAVCPYHAEVLKVSMNQNVHPPFLPIYFCGHLPDRDSARAIVGILLSENVLFQSSSSRRQIIEFLPRFLACGFSSLLVYVIVASFTSVFI